MTSTASKANIDFQKLLCLYLKVIKLESVLASLAILSLEAGGGHFNVYHGGQN